MLRIPSASYQIELPRIIIVNLLDDNPTLNEYNHLRQVLYRTKPERDYGPLEKVNACKEVLPRFLGLEFTVSSPKNVSAELFCIIKQL